MQKRKTARSGIEKLADIGLSGQEFAKLVRRTPGRISQLTSAGKLHTVDGLYRPADAVPAMIDVIDADKRRTSRSGDATKRFQEAKARSIELANAEREGELVEMEELRAIMEHVLGLLRTGLSGLPARLTRELAERRRIEDEVNAILEASAAAFERMAEELEARGVVLDAEPEDDA